ncbi:hypothetical protein [Neolewinella litorea]|uniref:Uncharacterized protein n=1 Tax=Neolewinella litorea TaxID=2562452 RepID=A0A4S4N636_9BACT|nr:hypothetical protein [Neolewinella litorea]THH34576.1 hypothetical protein E4021_17440 [Neolewinella litorea]
MHRTGIELVLAILLVSLQSCVSARVAEEQGLRIRELEKTVADYDRKQAENELIVRNYEEKLEALETRKNAAFDEVVNGLITEGNDNTQSVHTEATALLQRHHEQLKELASEMLSLHFADFIGQGLHIHSDPYNTRMIIDLDRVYDERTFDINARGRAILDKLNSRQMRRLVEAGFSFELYNVSVFTREGKEFTYPTPSPFLEEFAARIDTISFRNHFLGEYDGPDIPPDEAMEYLRDEFVLVISRPWPTLDMDLINMVARDGGIFRVENLVERPPPPPPPTMSAGMRTDLMPISLVSEPERSQKFLMLPSAYRLAGLYKSSATDDAVVRAVRQLEEKNKIIKYFDGTSPEAVRCDRHYAIVILREGEVVYKSDRVKIPCTDVKTFE